MKYFLAIIGGGPAGYTAAAEASKAGKDVVLFEQNALGGTCLNIGCIPTKTLLYSAKQYYQATHSTRYGIQIDQAVFDFQKMQQRKSKVVRKLIAGIKQQVNNEHCTLVTGAAVVQSRNDEMVSIICDGNEYIAENLMICTGSVNFVPPIPGIKDNPVVWDSTDALAATELPNSVIIVGGGVIGMEFATLYHELGVEVTIVEATSKILPNLDKECVNIVVDKYQKEGVRFLTNTRVMEICGHCVRCTCMVDNECSETQELEAERILVCVGRKANLQGLEALQDLEYNKGAIVVDDFMRTNLPNVYAAGDVTGKIMLAHVASRQAEVAVGRMLRQIPLQRIAYNAIPSVVYTNPEIASVGISVDDVDTEHFEVRQLPMAFSGRFVAENEGENGLCKVIVHKSTEAIMGIHLVGNPCSEFISTASFAVRIGATIPELRQVVFPHPTVSEIVRETL